MAPKCYRFGKFFIAEYTDQHGIFKIVFLDYVPVVQFHIDIASERKLAAVELVERGLCSQKLSGEICGYHRNTVFKLLRTKKLLGLEAMLRDDRGAKEPYKYVNDVRSHVKKLQRKYPDWSDQAIADQTEKDLGISVSRSAAARIRTEKSERTKVQTLPDKHDLLELAEQARAFDESCPHLRQLALNFDKDPELKEKSEEFAKEPAPKPNEECKQKFIAGLQAGQRCEFAGGLMHHLFFEEIDLAEIFKLLPVWKHGTYQGGDILSTLIHMALQEVPSIESLKLINSDEFGILIGCPRSPDKDTIRRNLKKLAQTERSDGLIENFARILLKNNVVDREVFFIDGHFLPYFGLHIIAKGYYTVRRLAMRGNELYAVTGLDGKPLFFVTESCEMDFRPIISHCAGMLSEWGVPRPLMVFDRGGYGIHFFTELSQTADFITWSKYLGKATLKEIPSEKFNCCVAFAGKHYLVAETTHTAKESAQTAKANGCDTPTSMELRLVVFEETGSSNRIGIYTCNQSKTAADIVFFMLHRWGDSENFFKEMMARFNLDYHPGYDIRELEQQPLVENPDIPLIKQAIKLLRKEIEETEKDILVTEIKLGKRKDKRNRSDPPPQDLPNDEKYAKV